MLTMSSASGLGTLGSYFVPFGDSFEQLDHQGVSYAYPSIVDKQQSVFGAHDYTEQLGGHRETMLSRLEYCSAIASAMAIIACLLKLAKFKSESVKVVQISSAKPKLV